MSTNAALDGLVTSAVSQIIAEGLIGPAAASAFLSEQSGGESPHPCTWTRWHHRGVKRADGTVVRLEMIKVGSKLMTSKAAILRFLTEINEPVAADAPHAPTPAARSRAATRAHSELGAILAAG